MKDNNSTKSTPVVDTRRYCTVITDAYNLKMIITDFQNKDYLKIDLIFPNGTSKDMFVNKSRFKYPVEIEPTTQDWSERLPAQLEELRERDKREEGKG